MNAEQLWLAVAIILFILEIITPGFVLANFGVAAIGSALAAWMGAGLEMQIAVFAMLCIVSFITVRPILKRSVLRSTPPTPTGVDALVGREATVSEDIPGGLELGRVQVDGDSWRAIEVNRLQLSKNTLVRILAVDSTTLTVEKI